MTKKKARYCSLDIETSGFDPLTCEILEVGFAFFELESGGIRITEEFTQVFKPAGEVAPGILGLTGISRDELDKAPSFGDYKTILQEKLGDAVIVGHNIAFDMNFLRHFGIIFSGHAVDTLELVQFILPTHHSYNLENLMHVFRVPHKEAHRALADAKATLVVLEKLLRLYSGYPAALKKQVADLLRPFNLPWEEWLGVKLAPVIFSPPAKPKAGQSAGQSLAIQNGKIYDFNLTENYLQQTVEALKIRPGKSLLAVPKDSTVMELWKEGRVSAVFGPDLLFDETKFEAFLKKPDKSPEEIRFLLKVLVWKHTNWQHECLLDLNLSFFGGQFRQQIAGGEMKKQDKPKLLCCSHATFCELARSDWYKNRLAAVEGLAELEQCLSSGLNAKVSWGYVSYLIRSYYNPELNTGNEKIKPEVLKILEDTDLFFGLAGAFFQEDPASFQYVKITGSLVYSEKFQKLSKAAVNYAGKLEIFAALCKSDNLMQVAAELQAFFALESGKVHWLELGDKRCSFHSALLDIAPLVKKLLAGFGQAVFVDSLGSAKILTYFVKRLGLEKFDCETVFPAAKKQGIAAISIQGDLFQASASPVQKAGPAVAVTVAQKPQKAAEAAGMIKTVCHILAKPMAAGDLQALLAGSNLPAAVLMGTAAQISDFYDANYLKLQEKAKVLANTYSGGSSKLFHNFFIDPDSILIVTDKFILKYLNSSAGLEPVKVLPVKTLVIGHLPFEQFSHPYQEAVTEKFPNAFLDYALPKAVYNLHRLLQFFNTGELEEIYVWDAKLAKGYGQDFKDYLNNLNGVEVVEE